MFDLARAIAELITGLYKVCDRKEKEKL